MIFENVDKTLFSNQLLSALLEGVHLDLMRCEGTVSITITSQEHLMELVLVEFVPVPRGDAYLNDLQIVTRTPSHHRCEGDPVHVWSHHWLELLEGLIDGEP